MWDTQTLLFWDGLGWIHRGLPLNGKRAQQPNEACSLSYCILAVVIELGFSRTFKLHQQKPLFEPTVPGISTGICMRFKRTAG